MHGNDGQPCILGSGHQLIKALKLAVSVDTGRTETFGGAPHDHDQRLGIAEIGGSGKVIGGKVHALLLHHGGDHLVIRALTAGGDERRVFGKSFRQAAGLRLTVVIAVAAIIRFISAGGKAEHHHSRQQQCKNFFSHTRFSFRVLCGGRRLSRRP